MHEPSNFISKLYEEQPISHFESTKNSSLCKLQTDLFSFENKLCMLSKIIFNSEDQKP